MTDLLNLRSVSSAYGKSQVLWDVAFDLKAGEAATVLGRKRLLRDADDHAADHVDEDDHGAGARLRRLYLLAR